MWSARLKGKRLEEGKSWLSSFSTKMKKRKRKTRERRKGKSGSAGKGNEVG